MTTIAYGVEISGGDADGLDRRDFVSMGAASSFAGEYLHSGHIHGTKGSVTIGPIDDVDGPAENDYIVLVCPKCVEVCEDIWVMHTEAMNCQHPMCWSCYGTGIKDFATSSYGNTVAGRQAAESLGLTS
jgi:hypothetical protein